ncbi:hypothetical protein N658DRAFT_20067 [Parathielavia hyrcaniae]|uniref:Uncharacterized protein n=1 Tax=Parathielavia hyrcaniae TaxID=113614 RepID=A0AAN6T757_9PEZI|nr:hypothetical protein N658DRAFT_20067 [Parathielavia hyrcaniae]
MIMLQRLAAAVLVLGLSSVVIVGYFFYEAITQQYAFTLSSYRCSPLCFSVTLWSGIVDACVCGVFEGPSSWFLVSTRSKHSTPKPTSGTRQF